MIIHITQILNPHLTLELEVVSKDKETHSYLADRPDLMSAIIESVRHTITSYDYVNDNKQDMA